MLKNWQKKAKKLTNLVGSLLLFACVGMLAEVQADERENKVAEEQLGFDESVEKFIKGREKKVIAKVRQIEASLKAADPDWAEAASSAAGILIFPNAVRFGFGLGFEVAEGILLEKGKDYSAYRTSGFGLGFKFGFKIAHMVYLLKDEAAVELFKQRQVRRYGLSASLAIPYYNGFGGLIADAYSIQPNIEGRHFNHRGLMLDVGYDIAVIGPVDLGL